MAEVGWKGRKDTEFLPEAERAFDVFVTIDQKMERENDLSQFQLGFVIVRVKSNVITSWLPDPRSDPRFRGSREAGRDDPCQCPERLRVQFRGTESADGLVSALRACVAIAGVHQTPRAVPADRA